MHGSLVPGSQPTSKRCGLNFVDVWGVALYCGAWPCIVGRGPVLWCVALYCGPWPCIVGRGPVLWGVALYCGAWPCIVVRTGTFPVFSFSAPA